MPMAAAHVVDPDAVLALRAAGVGLVAVAVAETGVDAQPHAVAGRVLAERSSMSMEPAFTGMPCSTTVARVAWSIRSAVKTTPAGSPAGSKPAASAALDLAQRHRVDLHALFAHQAQDVQVGAGLLRVADDVEAAQLGDALADDGGVVDPQRGAVLGGELGELARIESHRG